MTEANEAIDMTEYYPDSLIRANILAARAKGDTDNYWNILEKKGKENEQIKSS